MRREVEEEERGERQPIRSESEEIAMNGEERENERMLVAREIIDYW